MSESVTATKKMKSAGIVVKADKPKIEVMKNLRPLPPEDDIKKTKEKKIGSQQINQPAQKGSVGPQEGWHQAEKATSKSMER
jgi:hypothetical protein